MASWGWVISICSGSPAQENFLEWDSGTGAVRGLTAADYSGTVSFYSNPFASIITRLGEPGLLVP